MDLINCTTPKKSFNRKTFLFEKNSDNIESTSKTKQNEQMYSTPKKEKTKQNIASISPISQRHSDRFVPNRANIDYDLCNHILSSNPKNNEEANETVSAKSKRYIEHVNALCSSSSKKRLIDCFDSCWDEHKDMTLDIKKDLSSSFENHNFKKKRYRNIPSSATRILDAPG